MRVSRLALPATREMAAFSAGAGIGVTLTLEMRQARGLASKPIAPRP